MTAPATNRMIAATIAPSAARPILMCSIVSAPIWPASLLAEAMLADEPIGRNVVPGCAASCYEHGRTAICAAAGVGMKDILEKLEARRAHARAGGGDKR